MTICMRSLFASLLLFCFHGTTHFVGAEPPTASPVVCCDGPETVAPTVNYTHHEDMNNDTGIDILIPVESNETDAPTGSPMALTFPPTSSPTESHQQETAQPSAAPSEAEGVFVSLVGQVPLKLTDVPALLIAESMQTFLVATTSFLSNKLSPQFTISRVGVERQVRQSVSRRHLSSGGSLYVELQVVGGQRFDNEDDASSFSFDETLRQVFDESGNEFAIALQTTEGDFFTSVHRIDVVSIEEDSTTAPTVSPNQGNSDDEGDSMSIPMVVGIGVGALLVIVLLAFVYQRASKKKNVNSEAQSVRTGGGVSGDTPQKRNWLRNARTYQQQQEAAEHIPDQPQSSDVESQGLYSYTKNDSDSLVSASIMHNTSLYGADTMSYAYSLEPGVENSVAGCTIGSDGTKVPAIPTEIPHISVQSSKHVKKIKPTNTEVTKAGSTDDVGMETVLKEKGLDQSMVSMSPSDLKLTESEIEMLPSNLRSEVRDNGTRNVKSTKPSTRVVLAPAGRLGVVIDTTVDGPVVHHVNESSALRGKVRPGDIIVGIDNVDTRAMSASAITALMIKTAQQQRRLTIVQNPKDR